MQRQTIDGGGGQLVRLRRPTQDLRVSPNHAIAVDDSFLHVDLAKPCIPAQRAPMPADRELRTVP